MVGTIVGQEMLLGGRRFRLHVLRWVLAGWLVLQVLWLFWLFATEEFALARIRMMTRGGETAAHASAPEVVGARFASLFVWQQAVLLFLITPVVTGSALIDEKREGTLQYLLLTEVETRHLVLGKLIGRTLQVLLLLMAGLPLFALLAGFGAVAPLTLVFVFASQLLPLFGMAALTLLVSVWCRQVRDAVLTVSSLVLAGWVAQSLVGGPLSLLNPLWVLEPAWGPIGSLDLPEALRRLGGSAALWGGLTVGCLATAAAALRGAYIRQMTRERKDGTGWLRSAVEPIEDDPIHWREENLEGLAPLAMLRSVPRWLGITLVGLASAVSSSAILLGSLAPGASLPRLMGALLQLNLRDVSGMLPDASLGFLGQGVVVTFLASLVVGIRCAGTVTLERENKTWEALLLTPLSAHRIVQGKLWGIMEASYAYLLAYAGPALCLSALAGPLALIYTLVWLAVTVLAMYFLGATGLYCSVRSQTSWGSLLKTLGIGYLGSLAVSLVCSPGFFILIVMMLLMLVFIDLALGTSLSRWSFSLTNPTFIRVLWLSVAFGLAVLFWLLARLFLRWAHRWVADRERTRHWEDAPVYRRSRMTRAPTR